MSVKLSNPRLIVDRLIELQRRIRQSCIDARHAGELHGVRRVTVADTIYGIDAIIEPQIEEYLAEWGAEQPIMVIAEGLEAETGRIFPPGASESAAEIRLILDPIDGTRGLMYDKRSAWSLAGAAPNHGQTTRLRDIEVAVMTELPTSKMGQADVLWAVRGEGMTARRVDLGSGAAMPITLAPATQTTIEHGFASVVNFVPGTKVLASELAEELARKFIAPPALATAAVFDDQYISTGGQFYELVAGHDRFIADLRPQFYAMQHQAPGLCCHPYDCATWLIAAEAGVILTDAVGHPLDGPLDTTTGMNWVGYANAELQRKIEPLLRQFLQRR